MAKLTAKKRARMRKSTFALPAKKSAKRGSPAARNRYPINDVAHARSAMSYASRPGNTTTAQKRTIANKVKSKFPGLAKRSKFVQRYGSK